MDRGVGAILFKKFPRNAVGIFTNSSVLIEILVLRLGYEANRKDELYINLNTLAGVKHLFIRSGNILGGEDESP